MQIDKEGKTQVDKEGKAQVAYGYEVEYRKLFEDSVSINCRVPIVGLLGQHPLICVILQSQHASDIASACLAVASLSIAVNNYIST